MGRDLFFSLRRVRRTTSGAEHSRWRGPMNLPQVLDSLKASRSVDTNVTRCMELPSQPPRYAPFPERLDSRLVEALQQRGIPQLYTHQAEAVEAALSGQSTVVVTPTASGKTLCYNLPVLQSILQEPASRAL